MFTTRYAFAIATCLVKGLNNVLGGCCRLAKQLAGEERRLICVAFCLLTSEFKVLSFLLVITNA